MQKSTCIGKDLTSIFNLERS